MGISKTLRTVCGVALTAMFLPAGATIISDAVKDAGMLTGVLTWLGTIAGAGWYYYLLVGVAALACGVWLDWLARRLDTSKQDYQIGLAARMDLMRARLVSIGADFAVGGPWISSLTLYYADMIALQRTIERTGIKAPWLAWEVGVDPTVYVNVNVGFLTLISPLLRDGHVQDAKEASRTYIDWFPLGPGLVVNGAFVPFARPKPIPRLVSMGRAVTAQIPSIIVFWRRR